MNKYEKYQQDEIEQFWNKYEAAVLEDGVKAKNLEWYAKNAQWYINAHPRLKLRKHVGSDVSRYLCNLVNRRNFKEWQYVQNVEAIRILFQKVVKAEWADEFPWSKWKEPHLHFPEELVRASGEDDDWKPDVHREYFEDSLDGMASREVYKEYFDKLRTEIRKKHYSIRTEQSYENWVARFMAFHGDINPRLLAARHVKEYLDFLDDNERPVGILTSTDIRFSRNANASVTDVMTKEVISAPEGTTLQEAYEIMMNRKIGKLPLVKDGKLVGLYSFSDIKTLVEHKHPQYNRDPRYRLRVAAAISQNDHARAEQLADAEADVIVVDSAHGHTKGIIDMVKWLAKHYPDIDIIAGNIATGEAATTLRDAGAHAVKVGIGPGSICTTRVVCGVGVPQITAIYEVASALKGSIPIIADGGIRHSGDVPKALAAGASSVMLGSVLAGTEESPGEKIIHQGRQYVVYRGMGSLAAMKEGKGSRERYNQDSTSSDDLVPQGIEGIVPYAGDVRKVMTQYCGGLSSSLGYCGTKDLKELREKALFVRVTLAGVNEAHPHDVKIMREAPNYRS
ncbi:hypothetical protein BVX94_03550 [bacterium B17]|nr:hypothetical protein BVX94_03550 [bacterium B17]